MTPQPINPKEQLHVTKDIIEVDSNSLDLRESDTPITKEVLEVLKVFDYSEKYSNNVGQNRQQEIVTNKSISLKKSVDLESIDDAIESVVGKSMVPTIEIIELSGDDESELDDGKDKEEDKIEETDGKSPFIYLNQYCSNCDESFVKHKRIAQNYCKKCKRKLLYECMICNRRYSTKNHVYSHLKTKYDCRKRPDLHCSECDYTSIHKGFLKHHMFTKHSSLNELEPCSKCGRHFKRKINAREHELSCGNAPYLECAYCQFKTTYRISFRVHMKNHIIDPKKGACLINENYEQVLVDPTIELSQIWKLGDTPKIVQNKIKCRSTNKKSARKKCYIDLYYRGLIKMFCYKCKETTAVREKKIDNCQKCQTVFLHECGLCTSKFNTCSNIIRHLRDRHSNLNLTTTYVCRMCNKIFNNFKKASNHETNCKRYRHACDLCAFKTKTPLSLTQHKEKWHFGPLKNQHRPCPICGRHMRYDSGITTGLICGYCR